jgi:hypothetical protein
MRELNVERLARAMDAVARESHDPEHGRFKSMDEDATLAFLTRRDAERLAAEYARLAESRPSDVDVAALRRLADRWDESANVIGERASIGDTVAKLATIDTLRACAKRLRETLAEADSAAPGERAMSVAMSDADEGQA